MSQVPFVRLVMDAAGKERGVTDDERKRVIAVTLQIVTRLRQEIRKVGFWKNKDLRSAVAKGIYRDLDTAGISPSGDREELAQRLVALAKENHEILTRQ
jgi:type I restriction enzyme R subunit